MAQLKKSLKRIPGLATLYRFFISFLSDLVSKVRLRDACNIEVELQMRALKETADYVEKNMKNVLWFPDRYSLLDATLNMIENENGLFLEFGVHKGISINYIAKKITNQIYGFDAFEGLPEDWRGPYGKGSFEMNSPPKVRKNVSLITGWFKDTLPEFLNQHIETFIFIHIDSDLYSSAKTILSLAGNRIRAGTIIVFDEYFNYPGWQLDGFKAFQEFANNNEVQYEYLGYCRFGQQVAVRILRRNNS